MATPTASSLLPSLAPSIKGKTLLVIGASPDSLGARFLESIKPAQPGMVLLGSRSSDKVRPVAETLAPIATQTFRTDMASFKSIRQAAEDVKSLLQLTKIDCIVNSAGSMAAPYNKTEDGVESQFQINHLGFFLFLNIVMPALVSNGGVRVVNVTSEEYALGHVRYNDVGFHNGEGYDPFLAYGQAKSAQILFASALATRLRMEVI